MTAAGRSARPPARRFLVWALAAVVVGGLILAAGRALTRQQSPGLSSVTATNPAAGTNPGTAIDSPAPTQSQASGPITVIDHVVVLMQENRSFDSYFGQLPKEGQPNASGLPDGASNPNPLDPAGAPVAAFHQARYCERDLEHAWDGVHRAWAGGKMDGFTAASADSADPTGSRAMGYYDGTDLPYYYALASTFGIGDRYFASTLAGTDPNRYYLYAGTSFGHVLNDATPTAGWTQPTIFNRLDDAHVSWKIYYSNHAFASRFAYVRNHPAGNVVPIAQYFADAAAGTLPQVAFIDPTWDGRITVQDSEHPPGNIQLGQKFVAGVVGALMASPNWSSSAFFLTYDEGGGLYDHVAPPPAPAPDAIAPLLAGVGTAADFGRYGIRVPMLVVSPYARPHFVSHVVNDHTSVLSFLEHRFDLPALSRRDAAANALLEFFDFNRATFANPPALPAATVDASQLADCVARFPGILP